MPELPEVETTRRGIAPHTQGKVVAAITVRNSRLRWPVDSELPRWLVGQYLLTVGRRGKYLLLHFKAGTLLVHLGMSGSLRMVAANAPIGTHDHIDVVFRDDANSDAVVLRYNDPRRFGAFVWHKGEGVERHSLLAELGPEPLDEVFTGDYFYVATRQRKQPLKSLIMNAKVVVGVGNIYANEALFAAGLHPLKAAEKLTKPKAQRLVVEIKRILQHAITRGGTTLRDFVGGDGKPGYFAQELAVYGRGGEPCKQCAKPLTEKRLQNRTTVFCTACQC